MTEKEPFNPYAPPATSEPLSPGDGEGPSWASQRFSVLALFGIAVVTLGLYQPFWLFKRRRFLDSLDCEAKLGLFLPVAVAALLVLVLFVAVFSTDKNLVQVLQFASGVASLIAIFRVRRILRSHFARNRIGSATSGAATFFFGALYLQHKINAAADEYESTREFERTHRPREREDAPRRVDFEPDPDPEGERALRKMNESISDEHEGDE